MRTFLFVISRGLVSRNLLRTHVLDTILAAPDARIILLFPRRQVDMPKYLLEEFSHPRIFLEEVTEFSYSPLVHRLWMPFVNNLVYSKTTDLLARDGSAKVKPVPSWWYPFHKWIFSSLTKIHILKSFFRLVERVAFVEERYDELFKKYQPEAVLVGSLLSKIDIGILKAAQRHHVTTFGMQKGWDNLERVLIRTVPDQLLLQNSIMIRAAERVQCIPAERLHMVGFPQFDAYVDYVPARTKQDFLREKNLHQDTRIFFFGSEGAWSPNDIELVRSFLKLRAELPFPSVFIIRPHFTDIKNKRFELFRNVEGIILDADYRWDRYFADLWDPSQEDMRHFTEELYFSDAVLCIASTLSLDAACLDRPIINIGFSAYINEAGRDLSVNLYSMEHYRPVVESGGVELVKTEDELKEALIRSITDPTYRSGGRAKLRKTMCGLLDGKAGERIAHYLLFPKSDS